MLISTLKNRIAQARTKLGNDKADAILARALEDEKKKYGREFLTLRRQREILEQAAAPSRTEAKIGPSELVAQYDLLRTDQSRRDFWNAHGERLSDQKAKVSGLVLACMMQARPLSTRAKCELPQGKSKSGFEKAREYFEAQSAANRQPAEKVEAASADLTGTEKAIAYLAGRSPQNLKNRKP